MPGISSPCSDLCRSLRRSGLRRIPPPRQRLRRAQDRRALRERAGGGRTLAPALAAPSPVRSLPSGSTSPAVLRRLPAWVLRLPGLCFRYGRHQRAVMKNGRNGPDSSSPAAAFRPVGDCRLDPLSEPRAGPRPGTEPDHCQCFLEPADPEGHAHHRPDRHAARRRLHGLRVPGVQGQGRAGRHGY